jgi:hypothetical protein
VIPQGLAEDLPEGFTFDRGIYQLDWERWTLPEVPGASSTNTLIGVSIATDDELLGNAVAALMGPRGWYTLGHNATFLVSGM